MTQLFGVLVRKPDGDYGMEVFTEEGEATKSWSEQSDGLSRSVGILKLDLPRPYKEAEKLRDACEASLKHLTDPNQHSNIYQLNLTKIKAQLREVLVRSK